MEPGEQVVISEVPDSKIVSAWRINDPISIADRSASSRLIRPI